MTGAQFKAKTAARLLLGAIFAVFGLNGFLHFIPQPPPAGLAAVFVGGLGASGYFFPLLKGTEVLVGLALLGNRFVPLALTVLAPIVVNIVAFHAFLAPAGIVLPLVIVALGSYLAYTERAVFAPLLRARSKDAAPQSNRTGRVAHAAT
ncbi:MAG TPA: DoxX family protein [Polyangiaceae bacterium]|nr:DoxX family protein [Polyangiaceae bacterium]